MTEVHAAFDAQRTTAVYFYCFLRDQVKYIPRQDFRAVVQKQPTKVLAIRCQPPYVFHVRMSADSWVARSKNFSLQRLSGLPSRLHLPSPLHAAHIAGNTRERNALICFLQASTAKHSR